MNQALHWVAGIFKSSPLKDTKSNHHNTQGCLSREHQDALGDGWEVWGQPLSEEVWWIGLGQDEVRQPLSATPLTAQVEGKCKDITSDHSEWGQMPTPLNKFIILFLQLPSAVVKLWPWAFFPLTSQGNRLLQPFYQHPQSFPTLVFTHFHLSSLKTMTTWFYMGWILFGLWGCEVLSFATLEGVCWIILSIGSSNVRSWLVSTTI